jgi:hypothetical protein
MYKTAIPFILKKDLLRRFLGYWFLVSFIPIITTTTGFGQSATPLPPAAQEAINKGIVAARVPDYLLAVRYFEEARKAAPQSSEVFFNLGLAESKIPGRELRAICWFGAYLTGNPGASNTAAVKEQITTLNIKNQSNLIRLLNMVKDAADQIAVKDESAGMCDVVEMWVDFGDLSTALKTADLINKKDAFYKGLSLEDIAYAQLETGDIARAFKTTNQIELARLRCDGFLSIALSQLRNADTAGAQKTLAIAFKTAGQIHADLSSGLLSNTTQEITSLYEVAKTQAQAKDIAGAKRTIRTIRESNASYDKKYLSSNKAFALASIFLAQRREGDTEGAQKTLAEIQETIEIIEYKFHKDLAYYNLTEALARSWEIINAFNTAELIEDTYLKSRSQSAIASAQLMTGDTEGTRKTLVSAQKAVELIKDPYQVVMALQAIAETEIKAGNIEKAKKLLAIAQDSTDHMRDEFYKSLANRDIAAAKRKAGINDITVSDWLRKLDDGDKINDCPLNTEAFLYLDDYLKSLVRSDGPEEIFEGLKKTVGKIVKARNVVLQLLKDLNGN